MTLPQKITDAIDAHVSAVEDFELSIDVVTARQRVDDTRAALERTIADDRLRQVHIELLCASAQADVAGYLAQRMREVLADQATPAPAPSVIDAVRAVLFHGLTNKGTLVAGPQLREKLLVLKAVVESHDVRSWERSEAAQFGEPPPKP